MERTDHRFLPVLLLGAQAVVWPGYALLRGAAPTAAELLAAALVGGLVAVALAVRRTRPVPVLILVAAACAVGAAPLPAGAVAVLGTAGVALALFTVAVERDTTTALLCVATLAVWQLVHGLSLHGLGGGQGLDLVLTALLYAAATGTGLSLRRLRAARRAAERRLHQAEDERHRLPAAERRRMERELHDVSAHHLTAVVVTVEAALGLRDRRPELVDEAVEFAAETGREVTRALSAVRAPTPTPEDLPAPEERLRELVAGFRALGQPVTCRTEALPDGSVGDAAYGIVREALTNVVRHASGAPTTVRCAYGDDHTEIVVRNAPPDASGAGTPRGQGLGGGNGQNFLRGRAREAGGTLTSGPTPDGGWEVRAVLPGRNRTAPSASVPRTYRLAQFTAAAGLCLQPLLPFLVIRESTTPIGPGVSPGALFALLATAQVLTLLWLRQAPRIALSVLLVLAGLWPAAMAVSGYAGPVLLPPGLSMIPTCVALAMPAVSSSEAGPGVPSGEAAEGATALPRRATGVTVRRRAVPVVAAVVHTAAVIAAVLARDAATPAWAVVGASTAMTASAAAAWSVGTWYGKRGRAERDTHQDRLAAWTEEAVRDAWAERRRITVGLETTVLARTAEVVEEAEAGRLAQTAERARDALTAMRSLLETVRAGEQHAELRPQPTLQALDLLVGQCRATGRQVEVRLTDRVPKALPAEVDIAAYRAAETILRAGGDEPAALVLDAEDRVLTLTATGVSHATRLAARERLVTRAAALGGTLTTEQPDTVLLRLPFSTVPDDGATPRAGRAPNAGRPDADTDPYPPRRTESAPLRGDQEEPQ
ncbi:putative two-component system sensor kinase [Streptomyces sp. L-9-10]|uniref:sensor histidine kinase n=1 Tax=Streptomyces sp. L-9-10 TaxID=1478131 RepID=UPI00101B96FE|nr:histidine kinase [Streptomyces sp. L-9-10]RYJ25232.1 putative two-component system sensor kinase [Streptomyces sp. L-9-10]